MTRLRNLTSKLRLFRSWRKLPGLQTDNIDSAKYFAQRNHRVQSLIPDFHNFTKRINELYKDCLPVTGGENAVYIPELAGVDPRFWGVSLCTVDGQRHSVGDADVSFTLQSGVKCFSYAIAVDEYGSELIHQHVGKEPSGTLFNSLSLNSERKPHNPMVNSGAIVMCSLIKPNCTTEERLDFILQKICEMAALPRHSFNCNMDVYKSEIETAHRNSALVHYMKDMKTISSHVSPEDILQFYTLLCSVEANCKRGAVMAATLANGGDCPLTGNKVIKPDAVRSTLALMQSCGMYDSAGEFTYSVGLPAKSGVSGVILLVVPRVMGLCLFSPRVDDRGNSIRGTHFCKRLVESFHLHPYDNLGPPAPLE